ncbi:MAG: hypothetical protein EOP04_29910, partial [Proteobacteria bacterium]
PERVAGFKIATDILSGQTYALNSAITVEPMQMRLLELK